MAYYRLPVPSQHRIIHRLFPVCSAHLHMHEGQALNPFSSCQSSEHRNAREIIRDGSLFLHCKTGSLCNHGRSHLVPPSGHNYLTQLLLTSYTVLLKRAAHHNFRFLKLQLNHISLKYMTAATFQKGKGEGQQLEPQKAYWCLVHTISLEAL